MAPGDEKGTTGVDYFFSISWVDGCETVVNSVDPKTPPALAPEGTQYRDVLCSLLLYNAWLQCKLFEATIPSKLTRTYAIGTGNKGRGGYIEAGCLRYDFTPRNGGRRTVGRRRS
jgi:hypothetical protein